MSQFAFLQREWPSVYEAALRAEISVHRDPRTACFYARRALELAVARSSSTHNRRSRISGREVPKACSIRRRSMN
jgi:hypothetical protein